MHYFLGPLRVKFCLVLNIPVLKQLWPCCDGPFYHFAWFQSTAMVMLVWSVHLTHFFLGKLDSVVNLRAHTFACN